MFRRHINQEWKMLIKKIQHLFSRAALASLHPLFGWDITAIKLRQNLWVKSSIYKTGQGKGREGKRDIQ